MPDQEVKNLLGLLADTIQEGEKAATSSLLEEAQSHLGMERAKALEPVQDWISAERPVGVGSRHRALLAVNEIRHQLVEISGSGEMLQAE